MKARDEMMQRLMITALLLAISGLGPRASSAEPAKLAFDIDSGCFACPLIVSIPKGKYKAARFVVNGKEVKRWEISVPFVLSLDKAKIGELPEGWVAAKTGEGPGSVWKVWRTPPSTGQKVLAQTSDQGPNRVFNLCVADKTSFTDIDLTVAFKAVAGKWTRVAGRCGDTRTPTTTTLPA